MAMTRANVLFVDPCDKSTALSRPWYINKEGYLYNNNGRTHTKLHHLIAPVGEGQEVDHINGIKWDNRRSNLRFVTHKENCQNRASLNRNNTSGFRGVVYEGKVAGRPWVAQVKVHGKYKKIGRFSDQHEAAHAAHVFRFQHQAGALD